MDRLAASPRWIGGEQRERAAGGDPGDSDEPHERSKGEAGEVLRINLHVVNLLWLEHHLDAAVLLLLEFLVHSGGVVERRGVGFQVENAQGIRRVVD